MKFKDLIHYSGGLPATAIKNKVNKLEKGSFGVNKHKKRKKCY